ncbi:MAG: heme ABC exporter ATP-binding protein CcmA [Acidimicrobiales bacterium]
MTLAVRLRQAVAFAGRYPLLAGVDLDVRGGEVVALCGANGAGKTSLLRAIAGLLPLSSGEACVLGMDPLSDARALRRQVGLLGHRNGLYEDLSALDNVRFAARAVGAPNFAAEAALERLGLAGRLATAPVSRLSAGQRRRVALAALLARRPALWLLDEPHAGLDAVHRQLLGNLLRDMAAQGATVLLASHEAATTEALAQRTVVVAGGVVLGGVLPPTGTELPEAPRPPAELRGQPPAPLAEAGSHVA